MPEQETDDPFGTTVDDYRAAGWTGTLPIPHGSKFPPPTGYTGEGAPWPSTEDITGWRAKGRAQNIALRMPPNVIVLDIDEPAAFFELAKTLGPLPATWRADSGGARLGHLYYRLPAGVTSSGWRAPCLGVDLLRHGHRYSVVWPSLHPNGTRYQWSPPDGDSTGRPFPRTADLPELPAAWVGHLAGVAVSSANDTAPPASLTLGHDTAPGLGVPIPTGLHDATLAAYAASRAARGDTFEEIVALVVRRGSDCVPAWAGPDSLEHAARARWVPGAMRKFARPYVGPEADIDPESGEVVWPWLDWHELWTRPAEADWLLRPLVPARRAVALYSPPKLGKSLVMLELAVALSRGAAVFGMTPDRPVRVLYVDFENDPVGDIRDRLQKMDVGPDDLGNLRYLSFPTMGALDTAAGGAQLLAAAQSAEAELVVIDTVSRTIQGPENDNDTWIQFYRNTGRLLKESGIAYIRLDHTGKDVERGMRGGSAKSSDVDAVWRLERVSALGAHPAEFLLACDSSRVKIPDADLGIALRRLDNPLRHERFTFEKYAAEIKERARIWQAIEDAGLVLDPETTSWIKIREAARAANIPYAGRKENGESNPFIYVVKAMAEWRRVGFKPIWAPGAVELLRLQQPDGA